MATPRHRLSSAPASGKSLPGKRKIWSAIRARCQIQTEALPILGSKTGHRLGVGGRRLMTHNAIGYSAMMVASF